MKKSTGDVIIDYLLFFCIKNPVWACVITWIVSSFLIGLSINSIYNFECQCKHVTVYCLTYFIMGVIVLFIDNGTRFGKKLTETHYYSDTTD